MEPKLLEELIIKNRGHNI